MRRCLVGNRLAAACAAQAAEILLALLIAAPRRATAVVCDDVDTVIAAVFQDASDCDVNGDGGVTAADVTAAIVSPAPPQPTATPTPSSNPTATRTPTTRLCPTSGAHLLIEIDNQTGLSSVSVKVFGERLGQECLAGRLFTSYNTTVDCEGTGVIACALLSGLAPGSWLHSVSVTMPGTRQVQHQKSLLIAKTSANRARFTAFASVLTVQTARNDGDGSLRNALHAAETAEKPLLIQFDPTAFPAGVPTTILLEFQLPDLATGDVTIDGTDANGAAGNRIIDAGGLAIPALAISGPRNHIIGMTLRNAGANNRDVLGISGPAADGNVVERTLIEGAATGDGIGVDQEAGKDFSESANVIRECEVRGASDKGIKVTTGAYARVERCWVHDNANGGIQATLGGHVQASHNLVERNRGSTAQNGLSVNPRDDDQTSTDSSELRSAGDISRGNGANGISVRATSMVRVSDDYLATNGSSGIRVFNDVGPPASAMVEGTSAVCNAVDGAVVANTSTADFGGGALGSPGDNAFTQNNLPGGGANFRNATMMNVNVINSQWEHCGHETTCNDTAIADFDLSDHGANTTFIPSQAHRSQQPPVLTAVAPTKGAQGDLLRIFGSGFNVIDGHFAEDNCADVVGRNRCVPLRGNCVQINGVSAPVEAVTPTMLVVRWPFTCIEPVPLVVKTDQGATVATSVPISVCTNEVVAP